MGLVVGGEGPLAPCSHAIVWTISPAATFDWDISLICCRYNAKYLSSTRNIIIIN